MPASGWSVELHWTIIFSCLYTSMELEKKKKIDKSLRW